MTILPWPATMRCSRSSTRSWEHYEGHSPAAGGETLMSDEEKLRAYLEAGHGRPAQFTQTVAGG